LHRDTIVAMKLAAFAEAAGGTDEGGTGEDGVGRDEGIGLLRNGRAA
jgi:hypothetical protein